jgi:hypothetical protein
MVGIERREHDVVVIGAGPHALAVLSALRRCFNPQQRTVCVVDPSGVWLENWNESFDSLGIEFLRSPAWAHPDALSQEGLLDFARQEGRMNEFREVSFDDTDLEGMCDKEKEEFGLPGTTLFRDFCFHLIGDLPHDFVRGKAIDIINVGSTYEILLEEGAGSLTIAKLHAKHVVLALGAGGRANIPASFNDVITLTDERQQPRVLHSSDWRRFSVLKASLSDDDTVLIVGGGLSAVQAAINISKYGAKRIILCSRRPLVKRYYDLPEEWMDRRPIKGMLQQT